MILAIQLNDNELREFFKNAGYECDMIPKPVWRTVTHGHMKESAVDVLHVITRRGKLPAKELFEDVMRLRAVHPDQVTINQIERIINN